MVKSLINVVAGIFHDGNKVFAAKRAYGSLKDLFEFPGGKQEIREDLKDTLKREIKEELSAEISDIVEREVLTFEYPTFFIHLHVFDAKVDKSQLKMNPEIHSEMGWYTYEELKALPWSPADKTLIREDLMEIKYKFYNASKADMTPINERYMMISDVRNLYDLLSECWGPKSCSSRLASKWSKENKTLAQCNPTSWLVQDIFGGEVYGVPLKNGMTHCFNKVGGVIFDLTSEQFSGEPIDYEAGSIQNREETFLKEPEKKARYHALKEALDALLNRW